MESFMLGLLKVMLACEIAHNSSSTTLAVVSHLPHRISPYSALTNFLLTKKYLCRSFSQFCTHFCTQFWSDCSDRASTISICLQVLHVLQVIPLSFYFALTLAVLKALDPCPAGLLELLGAKSSGSSASLDVCTGELGELFPPDLQKLLVHRLVSEIHNILHFLLMQP